MLIITQQINMTQQATLRTKQGRKHSASPAKKLEDEEGEQTLPTHGLD